MVDYLGLYKREIAAFFGNDSAVTQAARPAASLERPSYIPARDEPRSTPEIMTGYPNRLGTNRSNPYTEPGAY